MNNLGSNLIISLVNGQLWRIRVLKCVFWSDYFSLSKGRNNTVFSYFFTRFYPILAGFLGSRDGGESYDGTTVWYVKLKTVFRQRKANEAIGDSMKNMSVRNGFEINFENPILYRPYRPHIMKYPLQHDQNLTRTRKIQKRVPKTSDYFLPQPFLTKSMLLRKIPFLHFLKMAKNRKILKLKKMEICTLDLNWIVRWKIVTRWRSGQKIEKLAILLKKKLL